MYLEAVEVMEDEGQETMALDIFRQAIGQPAAPMLHNFSSTCCLRLSLCPVRFYFFLPICFSFLTGFLSINFNAPPLSPVVSPS